MHIIRFNLDKIINYTVYLFDLDYTVGTRRKRQEVNDLLYDFLL